MYINDPLLCQFTAPVPHLAVYTGSCGPPSPSGLFLACLSSDFPSQSPGHTALPNSTVCPSPISVALDSTPATERRWEDSGDNANPFQFSNEGTDVSTGSESGTGNRLTVPTDAKLTQKSKVSLSFSKFLKRGCSSSPVFATLSPKCPAVNHGKIQPLNDLEEQLQKTKQVTNFFQIKVDIPAECRIYPIDSEEEEESCQASGKDTVQEVICPWENLTAESKAG